MRKVTQTENREGIFYDRFIKNQDYQETVGDIVIKTIDMHTGGEPLRIITDGYPQLTAGSLLEYRRKIKTEHDYLRTSLMFEPRGHADMYGCILLPPFSQDADCSVIFMHNEGYSNMCGHAVIAIMTLAMKMKWVDSFNNIGSMTIEAPCGLIEARGEEIDGKIVASFECVPSFVSALNETVYIESLQQTINYDLAFGGAFYAYVNTEQLSICLQVESLAEFIRLAKEIKMAVIESSEKLVHPFEPEMNELYGVIFISDSNTPGVDSKNLCIFADGEVDRSPTGSGVSGRLAIHYCRKELEVGESMVIESIIGSQFKSQINKVFQYAGYKAVTPQVSGQAFVCARNQFIIDQEDPLKYGFLLR